MNFITKICLMFHLNKYSKFQSIMKDNVNQVKHNSKVFIVSNACLLVTFRHQDQQRDLLTVVPLPTHL